MKLRLLLPPALILLGAAFLVIAATGEPLPLFAGPFDVLIETSTPEDDVVVTLSNQETSSELKGWNGGGYKKIARVSSGQSLRFPRGWLYTPLFRGRTDISGTVAQPMYVQEEFYVTLTHAGETIRRAVCFKSHFSDNDECEYFGLDQVPIIRRRLRTFDEFQAEARRRAGSADLHSRNVKPQEWRDLSIDEKSAVATMEAIAYCISNDYRYFQYWHRTPQFLQRIDKYRTQRPQIVDRLIRPHLRENRTAGYAEQYLGDIGRSLTDFPGWVSRGLELYGDKELEVIDHQ